MHGLPIVLNEVIQTILDESLCDVGYRVDRSESGRMKPGAEGNGGGRKRGGAARFSIKFRVPLVVESCCKFNERIMLTKRLDSDIPVVMDMRGGGGERRTGRPGDGAEEADRRDAAVLQVYKREQ